MTLWHFDFVDVNKLFQIPIYGMLSVPAIDHLNQCGAGLIIFTLKRIDL
jgi:hypothetical protein